MNYFLYYPYLFILFSLKYIQWAGARLLHPQHLAQHFCKSVALLAIEANNNLVSTSAQTSLYHYLHKKSRDYAAIPPQFGLRYDTCYYSTIASKLKIAINKSKVFQLPCDCRRRCLNQILDNGIMPILFINRTKRDQVHCSDQQGPLDHSHIDCLIKNINLSHQSSQRSACLLCSL